ncbi:MAG: hypothetical protein ACI4J4_01160 [Ruminiclostridium sp.]
MKIKEKYKLFNHARREYSKKFARNYEFTQMSYKKLINLLKANKHTGYCEYWYCCHGLYHNCWQDHFSEGIWEFSQEDVNVLLTGVLKTTRKYLKNKYRALCCKSSDGIHVILVMRDVHLCDYIITFTNKDY